MRRRLVAIVTLIALAVAAPAISDEGESRRPGDDWGSFADARKDETGVDLRARDGSDPTGPAGTPLISVSVSDCHAAGVDDDFERERVLHHDHRVPRRAVFYWWHCPDGSALRWYEPGTTTPHDDSILAALVTEAFERLQPDPPALVTAPPLGSTVLTGMPLYLAVDPDDFAALAGAVTAGQFTVTATLTPLHTRFAPGDQHDTFDCDGNGTLWRHGDRPGAGDCTHTYTHVPAHLDHDADHYPLTASIVYQATYTIDGPLLAGTYDLGTLDGAATDQHVPVIERRAVRTGH